jgi:CheY-like chemotaxis protein
LADDHAMVREALALMLERLDTQLTAAQAPDLPAAIAMLEQDSDLALLLLDYNMPGMAGAQSVRELRQLFPALPIGIISGYLSNQSNR